jgi:carbon-monoxide dehydrogenase medium subunit
MVLQELDYRRADSVDHALELLADAENTAVIAGGQGLVPDAKLGRENPDAVVDISRLDALSGLDVGQDAATVGALTTHATLADADALRRVCPGLAETAEHVADTQVRNRGTIGGNLAEADPAADLPAAVVAAGASLTLRGPDGERSVPAGEFFEGDGKTALGNTELLTSVRVPSVRGGAYEKKTHPASGYALVGVAATLDVQDGTIANPRVAATGVVDRPVRLRSVENALRDAAPTEDVVQRAAERAGDGLAASALRSDVEASGEFRVHLLSPYSERALGRALDRATADTEGSRDE